MTADPLTEDSRLLLAVISSHSGIAGEYVAKMTGFTVERCIDGIKPLVNRQLVYMKYDDSTQWFQPRFETCRFFLKV